MVTTCQPSSGCRCVSFGVVSVYCGAVSEPAAAVAGAGATVVCGPFAGPQALSTSPRLRIRGISRLIISTFYFGEARYAPMPLVMISL